MSLTHPAHRLDTYQQRREKLAQWMRTQGGGVAIIPTGRAAPRADYTNYPFHFDSQFFYLSGFTEPDAWLALSVTPEKTHSILFCQTKDPQTEIWDGVRWGPAAAREAFGVDQAEDVSTLDTWMSQHLAGVTQLFLPMQRCADPELKSRASRWIQSASQHSRGRFIVPQRWLDLTETLSQHRLIKDEQEIETMRRSAAIAAEAHKNAMRATRPGLTERALEGEILATFLRQGAQGVAYETIVATGANACVLHHRAGHSVIGDNDLILIDAGCELDGYASDITRTFPASGRFSAVQATLYDIVLAAQQAAIAVTRPGMSFNDGHEAAVRVLTQGLIDERLLTGSLQSNLEQNHYQRFYMHRTGHWLGLDVHDVGRYRAPSAPAADSQSPVWQTLEPGMILTIEPGLYIRPAEDVPEHFWNTGIRIEDDALVTSTGCDLLTRKVPVERAAIEAIMQER